MRNTHLLEQTAEKRLIILDPSLKNTGGHYHEYDVAIAAAALRRAMHTWVYAHKSCDVELALPGGKIHPWFSAEWSASGGRAKTSARFLLSKLPVSLRVPLTRISRRVWSLAKKQAQRPINPETATISAAAENFGKEVTTALRHANCGEDDIIFLPTIRTSELFAL